MRDVEHGMVVQSSPLPEHWSRLDAPGVADVLSRRFVEITSGLDTGLATLAGGGWEVVSHDTMIIGNSLVVSFLVRRARVGDRET